MLHLPKFFSPAGSVREAIDAGDVLKLKDQESFFPMFFDAAEKT
jgi:hypothetical protein